MDDGSCVAHVELGQRRQAGVVAEHGAQAVVDLLPGELHRGRRRPGAPVVAHQRAVQHVLPPRHPADEAPDRAPGRPPPPRRPPSPRAPPTT